MKKRYWVVLSALLAVAAYEASIEGWLECDGPLGCGTESWVPRSIQALYCPDHTAEARPVEVMGNSLRDLAFAQLGRIIEERGGAIRDADTAYARYDVSGAPVGFDGAYEAEVYASPEGGVSELVFRFAGDEHGERMRTVRKAVEAQFGAPTRVRAVVDDDDYLVRWDRGEGFAINLFYELPNRVVRLVFVNENFIAADGAAPPSRR